MESGRESVSADRETQPKKESEKEPLPSQWFQCRECRESFRARKKFQDHLRQSHNYRQSDIAQGYKKATVREILHHRRCSNTKQELYLAESKEWDSPREVRKKEIKNPNITDEYKKGLNSEPPAQIGRKPRVAEKPVIEDYDEEKSIRDLDNGKVDSLLSFLVRKGKFLYVFRVLVWADGPPVWKLVLASRRLVCRRSDLIQHLLRFHDDLSNLGEGKEEKCVKEAEPEMRSEHGGRFRRSSVTEESSFAEERSCEEGEEGSEGGEEEGPAEEITPPVGVIVKFEPQLITDFKDEPMAEPPEAFVDPPDRTYWGRRPILFNRVDKEYPNAICLLERAHSVEEEKEEVQLENAVGEEALPSDKGNCEEGEETEVPREEIPPSEGLTQPPERNEEELKSQEKGEHSKTRNLKRRLPTGEEKKDFQLETAVGEEEYHSYDEAEGPGEQIPSTEGLTQPLLSPKEEPMSEEDEGQRLETEYPKTRRRERALLLKEVKKEVQSEGEEKSEEKGEGEILNELIEVLDLTKVIDVIDLTFGV